LVWDDALALVAESWAKLCVPHQILGQNIAIGDADFNATDAVRTWVGEWKSYHPNNPKASNWTQGDASLCSRKQIFHLVLYANDDKVVY